MKIGDLENNVKKLSPKDKSLFYRLFTVSNSSGKLVIPKGMLPWVKKTFGNVESVKTQKIVNVLNNFTYEGALYNELRSKRPMSFEKIDLEQYKEHDVFANPLTSTPEDTFGRIDGEDDITASNIAKYDDQHGLVIFDKFNPLNVTKKELEHHFTSALKWFSRIHKEDKKNNFPVVLWNCLFKSGASLVHGHMQTLLSDIPYGRIGRKNQLAEDYKKKYKMDYFDDLFNIHKKLGLATNYKSCRIYVNLTPAKEKETVILADDLNFDAMNATYEVVEAFKKLGVNSFNVFAVLKPMDNKKWNLPVIIRVVDRGKLSAKTTDVGALELFTQHAVIGSDPYKVIKEIKKRVK